MNNIGISLLDNIINKNHIYSSNNIRKITSINYLMLLIKAINRGIII